MSLASRLASRACASRFLLAVSLLAVAGCRTAEEPPRRVVLVTIDTLRADHLGAYGYPRLVSPFVDQLAAEGALFENAYASSSTTTTCHASLFTSLYPPQHQLIRNGEELHDSVFTMAQMFQEQGYRTAAFTTVSFLRSLERGFETFSFEKKYFPASHLVDQATAWLDERGEDEPFFLWLHLFDVHEWYRPKHLDAGYRGVAAQRTPTSTEELVDYLERKQGIASDFFGGEEAMLDAVNRYDDQIAATDDQLRRFYRFVDEKGMNDDTLWIITTDHGEGIGSHRFRGHGAKIYNEQVRVPLILRFGDGRHAGKRIEQLVRHVDVFPTLAEILKTPLDRQVFPVAGESLLALLADDAAGSQVRHAYSQRRDADEARIRGGWEPGDVYSLQTLDYKYIFKSDSEDELYDLRQDPAELKNLIDEPLEIKDRMRDYLAELYRRMSEEGQHLGRTDIRPEYVEELKALGYL